MGKARRNGMKTKGNCSFGWVKCPNRLRVINSIFPRRMSKNWLNQSFSMGLLRSRRYRPYGMQFMRDRKNGKKIEKKGNMWKTVKNGQTFFDVSIVKSKSIWMLNDRRPHSRYLRNGVIKRQINIKNFKSWTKHYLWQLFLCPLINEISSVEFIFNLCNVYSRSIMLMWHNPSAHTLGWTCLILQKTHPPGVHSSNQSLRYRNGPLWTVSLTKANWTICLFSTNIRIGFGCENKKSRRRKIADERKNTSFGVILYWLDLFININHFYVMNHQLSDWYWRYSFHFILNLFVSTIWFLCIMATGIGTGTGIDTGISIGIGLATVISNTWTNSGTSQASTERWTAMVLACGYACFHICIRHDVGSLRFMYSILVVVSRLVEFIFSFHWFCILLCFTYTTRTRWTPHAHEPPDIPK